MMGEGSNSASEAAAEAGTAADEVRGRNLPVLILPLVVIVAVSLFVFLMGWHETLMSAMIANRSAAVAFVAEHSVLAIAAFVLASIAAVVFSVPGGVILTIIGGFLFGTLAGGLISLLA